MTYSCGRRRCVTSPLGGGRTPWQSVCLCTVTVSVVSIRRRVYILTLFSSRVIIVKRAICACIVHASRGPNPSTILYTLLYYYRRYYTHSVHVHNIIIETTPTTSAAGPTGRDDRPCRA